MTSISSITSDPTAFQNYVSNPFQQVRKDFAALKKSLNSNDLQGAQKAFATLQQDMQQVRQTQGGQQTQRAHHRHHHHHGGGAQGTQDATSNPLSDLAAIGSALQSNDLQGAQKAFATLQQDLGNAGSQNASADSGITNGTSGTDLATLSSALQANDLAGAQSAFATLMQDLRNSLETLGNSASGQTVGTNVNVSA